MLLASNFEYKLISWLNTGPVSAILFTSGDIPFLWLVSNMQVFSFALKLC